MILCLDIRFQMVEDDAMVHLEVFGPIYHYDVKPSSYKATLPTLRQNKNNQSNNIPTTVFGQYLAKISSISDPGFGTRAYVRGHDGDKRTLHGVADTAVITDKPYKYPDHV